MIISILGVFLGSTVLFMFGYTYIDLKSKDVRLKNKFFMAPLVIIGIILLVVIIKLLEK